MIIASWATVCQYWHVDASTIRDPGSARRVASVERAVSVLEALAGRDAELGTNEIARRTGVNASTVSRLLATLAHHGFVEQTRASGRYRLGVRLIQMGNAAVARLDLRELGRPQLRDLVEATGETATLSIPADPEAITVDFVQSPSSVQSVAQLGRPSVGHATATGKVMLAFGDTQPGGGRLERFTEHTIVDHQAVAAELDLTRERGWGRADGEREPDLRAIAAPVWGAHGELAAIIGIQGPSSRLTEAAATAAVQPLLERALALSRQLGSE
jgi:IclR family acetate operon transcriptional repressor